MCQEEGKNIQLHKIKPDIRLTHDARNRRRADCESSGVVASGDFACFRRDGTEMGLKGHKLPIREKS